MKYIVRVAQLTYGDIEVEANDRESAKELALDEENYAQIQWLESKSLRIAEVTKID